MAATDLPKWVWDLVIALQKHEDEHGDKTSCHAPVLTLIPRDVGEQADAIRHYARMASTDTAMHAAEQRWGDMVDNLTTTQDPERTRPADG